MNTNQPPLLAVDGIDLTFRVKAAFGATRQIPALRNVSFALPKGEALAIVGESGSGKSTIGRAIAGLQRVDSGAIRFKGTETTGARSRKERLAYRAAVQMIFQDPFAVLNPVHRIGHHLERPLAIHQRLRGHALREKARDLLASVELDPDTTLQKFPHELSGGQRQRVNLARALAVGAELIIADEPTSMLDVSIRRSVLELMLKLKREHGISFLYITHDIATCHYLAEKTLVMFAGSVVEFGPSDRVIGNPQHPYTRLLLSAVPNPEVRLATERETGNAFSVRAAEVRAISRGAAGAFVEIEPGHFARSTAQGAAPFTTSKC